MTHSTDVERVGPGDLPGRGPVGDPIPDPGLPEHVHRLTDTDPRAARRAERQVAAMFGLASICTILFIVAYIAFPLEETLDSVQISNLTLGLSLGFALFLIGAGAIHWAKKLMPDLELVQERTKLGADEATTKKALAGWEAGVEDSGIGRRPLIRRSLLGALALIPLPAVVLLKDLGPVPGNELSRTIWTEGTRVVSDVTYEPIRPEDVEIGQLVNALPASYEELPETGPSRLNVRADASVILVRLGPGEATVPPERENWNVDGIFCYSKICTHVGCPISLYEQVTHHLLCPCHQSTFDLADIGKVIFGPAARNMPQLAIKVDADGYLVAQGDFTEPVGPSFWERG